MNRFSLWHRTAIGGFRRIGVFEDQSAARYEGSRVVAERGGAAQVHTLGRGRAVLAPAELWPHDGSCLAPPASADVVTQRRSLGSSSRAMEGSLIEDLGVDQTPNFSPFLASPGKKTPRSERERIDYFGEDEEDDAAQ